MSEKSGQDHDWLANLPSEGLREMCTWEQFCRFAREPEQRKVSMSARIMINGTEYEVGSELAGETVVLLWGLFDDQLFIEFNGERTGPFYPISGPIPLHRYRSFKQTKADQRAERIRSLADQMGLPLNALTGEEAQLLPSTMAVKLPCQPFDPNAHEYHFPSIIAAKLAIADELAQPLAKLSTTDRTFINEILSETLVRRLVLARLRKHFAHKKPGENHAG